MLFELLHNIQGLYKSYIHLNFHGSFPMPTLRNLVSIPDSNGFVTMFVDYFLLESLSLGNHRFFLSQFVQEILHSLTMTVYVLRLMPFWLTKTRTCPLQARFTTSGYRPTRTARGSPLHRISPFLLKKRRALVSHVWVSCLQVKPSLSKDFWSFWDLRSFGMKFRTSNSSQRCSCRLFKYPPILMIRDVD